MTKTSLLRSFAILAIFVTSFAHAQLRVEIAGVGSNQIPVALAAFGDESVAPHQVSAIIKADLLRSGYFKIIDTGSVLTENSAVNFSMGSAC